jgi:hypothetical protein
MHFLRLVQVGASYLAHPQMGQMFELPAVAEAASLTGILPFARDPGRSQSATRASGSRPVEPEWAVGPFGQTESRRVLSSTPVSKQLRELPFGR